MSERSRSGSTPQMALSAGSPFANVADSSVFPSCWKRCAAESPGDSCGSTTPTAAFTVTGSGWTEPSPKIVAYFDNLPKRQRTAFAIAETKAQYIAWELEVFGPRRKAPR